MFCRLLVATVLLIASLSKTVHAEDFDFGNILTAQPIGAKTCPKNLPANGDKCINQLVCNYGLDECCGERFPTHTCECINGQFSCFQHSICKNRVCNDGCPTKEPIINITKCSVTPNEKCSYKRVECSCTDQT
eukprot:CAMPEP_0202447904 /NCGR_PEP_ID=MMETSP1360-20130828/6677_1 /ASSEMBLY_ACC=CAM_ASM_000848 /TAXON_ID=515479 /ORGANISM="Licmophora paradoxa, Strain CCMP2313" /LENGTH=132 /DNA_ID=CAMNT_0049065211 /DNA_START=53 /DNA_END=447 /DNA_ORIENTATION=+